MNEGLCWRIGNGNSVNSKRDLWIPECPSGRITSNVDPTEEVKVGDLIQNHISWDEAKINSIFLPYEVEVILKIPLSGNNKLNTRFWRFNKKGFYSVKLGYEIERKRNKNIMAGDNAGGSSDRDKIWNKI